MGLIFSPQVLNLRPVHYNSQSIMQQIYWIITLRLQPCYLHYVFLEYHFQLSELWSVSLLKLMVKFLIRFGFLRGHHLEDNYTYIPVEIISHPASPFSSPDRKISMFCHCLTRYPLAHKGLIYLQCKTVCINVTQLEELTWCNALSKAWKVPTGEVTVKWSVTHMWLMFCA